jgi:hypothetical protein
MTPGQAASIAALAVDLVTAEVAGAFQGAGVECILLKGPSLVALLYTDGTPRPYRDSDFLVPVESRPAAAGVLERLGFRTYLDDADTPGWSQAANHWLRGADGANVDLHWTLTGIVAPAQELWAALAGRTESMSVGGANLRVLDREGRALHLALHAAQHGPQGRGSLEDLRRAVDLLEEEDWRGAAELARNVDALPAFATGLRLTEHGQALADRLGLPTETTREAALLATSPPPATMGIEHFSQARGAPARARIVARKLIPTRRFMRAWSPLARRGALGLAAAYLWRPLWLFAQAPRGLLAWRRARRDT